MLSHMVVKLPLEVIPYGDRLRVVLSNMVVKQGGGIGVG